MVQTPAKPLTLEAFLQQPETKPAREYIDGQIIQKPMPKAEHSVIQTDLASAINAVLKPNRKGRSHQSENPDSHLTKSVSSWRT